MKVFRVYVVDPVANTARVSGSVETTCETVDEALKHALASFSPALYHGRGYHVCALQLWPEFGAARYAPLP